MSTTKTTVTNASDAELAALFSVADDVMLPDEKEDKNLFSRTNPDEIFDKSIKTTETDDDDDPGKDPKTDPDPDPDPNSNPDPFKKTDVDPLAKTEPEEDEEEEDDKHKTPGASSTITQITKGLIEKGIFVPFEGEEDLKNYKTKDYEELIEMNLKKIKDDTVQEVQQELFESWPEEMQYAAQYIANGGRDLKSLFQALSASQEIAEMDVSEETSQEQIVRAYLQATKYGTAAEINEEVDALKDRGDLEKKAKQFQPKLKSMQDQIVQQRVQYQAQQQQERIKHSQMYAQNVYKTIEKGNVNGIPMDVKTQELLFNGLTQPVYPTAQGTNTNLLGHLLQKYQWVEPNHELISEVLWLLADRDGYHAKVKETVKKEVDTKVMRHLKDAAAAKGAGNDTSDDDDSKRRVGIKRPGKAKSIFARD